MAYVFDFSVKKTSEKPAPTGKSNASEAQKKNKTDSEKQSLNAQSKNQKKRYERLCRFCKVHLQLFSFFFYNNKKNIVLKKLLLLMQHFYQFYDFFGEEKCHGEESIVSSWSGFCEQESLYLKFTFVFLCEIYKFLFSFICREMSSDDEEVGT